MQNLITSSIFLSLFDLGEHDNGLDLVFDDHLKEVRNGVLERTLRCNERWSAGGQRVVLDPTSIDVVGAFNRVG